MKYQLYVKNFEITPSLREYLADKLKKMEHFSDKIISFNIDLSRDAHHHKGQVYRAEFNIAVGKKLVRVVETDFDIHAAIDKARDNAARQLTKIKEKETDDEQLAV
ncbi:MAG: ribosome-associated translation inhibitor RaiA [Patescibacteria group bacterium]|jgi:putative sigma-54 modulation protein